MLTNDLCGCETRRDTIGEQWFFNGGILAGAAVLLLMVKGGAVSKRTKDILMIALAGAALAIISDAVIRPMLGRR